MELNVNAQNKINPNLNGMRILLAEDDDLNILILQKILSGWNAIISVAKNGLNALERVKDEPFEMIIMDIKMPVMDGLTASKEIRLLDSMIPIIALTSDKSPEIKAEFAEIEICELMYKPINQDLLYQLIRRCLLRKAIFSLS